MDIGYLKGEKCNRDNCDGIIDEHEKEGGCSCHNNAPCSYCVDDNTFCPKCNHSGLDEQRANVAESTKNQTYTPFKAKELWDLDKTKIDWISKGHTHFSMIKEGVYPEGTTMEEVREKVKGTFGGRFTMFDRCVFKYIAYTD